MNVDALSSTQKEKIAQWVEEGQDLNSLQKSINTEFDLKLTFMDTRFLILDLGLELRTTKTEPKDENTSEEDSAGEAEKIPLPPSGKLDLSLNEITRPGMLISGDVKFPSGAYGSWFIDSQYRLGIDPAETSPEPTEEDMKVFQVEIKGFLRNHMGGI